jgi:hypothetical protein
MNAVTNVTPVSPSLPRPEALTPAVPTLDPVREAQEVVAQILLDGRYNPLEYLHQAWVPGGGE